MTPGPAVCVYCRQNPADARWRPFCSERCRLLDLARWADGGYSVPGEPAPEALEDSDRPGADRDWPDSTASPNPRTRRDSHDS
jgi:endogenous inhibitor of DNA gyrase (YacG/DUF329 family)